MTAPFIDRLDTSTGAHLSRQRQRDLPRVLDAVVLSFFRAGHDTLTIAAELRVHESVVCRALSRARDAERAA